MEKKNKQQLTQQNVRQQCVHMMRSVHLHRHDMLTVPLTVLLNYQITRMTCTLPYQCSNQAGDNQSHSRILFSVLINVSNHVLLLNIASTMAPKIMMVHWRTSVKITAVKPPAEKTENISNN